MGKEEKREMKGRKEVEFEDQFPSSLNYELKNLKRSPDRTLKKEEKGKTQKETEVY